MTLNVIKYNCVCVGCFFFSCVTTESMFGSNQDSLLSLCSLIWGDIVFVQSLQLRQQDQDAHPVVGRVHQRVISDDQASQAPGHVLETLQGVFLYNEVASGKRERERENRGVSVEATGLVSY